MSAILNRNKRAIPHLASHVAHQQLHLFRRFSTAYPPFLVDECEIKPELVRDGSNPRHTMSRLSACHTETSQGLTSWYHQHPD